MHLSGLYDKLSKQLQNNPELMPYGERAHLEAVDRDLREHAARSFDRVFIKFAADCNNSEADPSLKWRFEDKEHIDGIWSGEWREYQMPEGCLEKRLIRRVIKLEAPAVDCLARPPEGRHFMIRMMLGTHDLRIHDPRARTHERLRRAVGLEALTTMYHVPDHHCAIDLYDEDMADEQFEDLFVYHEQSDNRFAPHDYTVPVFDDPEEIRRRGFTGKIKPCEYDSPHDQIKALKSSLLFLDDALL